MQINLTNTVFKADAGKKGAKAAWNTEMDIDLLDIDPEHVESMLQYIIALGVMYGIKQAQNAAETQEEAIAAMQERWDAWKRGETGKKAEHLGAVERRALENLKAEIRRRASKANLKMSDAEAQAQAKKIRDTTPERFAPWVESARQQIEAERQASQTIGADLDDLLSV